MITFLLDRKLLEFFDRLILEIWNRVGLTKIWQARVLVALYLVAATLAHDDFISLFTSVILVIAFQCVFERQELMWGGELANAHALAGRRSFISFGCRLLLWLLTLLSIAFLDRWIVTQNIVYVIYIYHACALTPTKPRIRKKKESRLPAELSVGY